MLLPSVHDHNQVRIVVLGLFRKVMFFLLNFQYIILKKELIFLNNCRFVYYEIIY